MIARVLAAVLATAVAVLGVHLVLAVAAVAVAAMAAVLVFGIAAVVADSGCRIQPRRRRFAW